MRFYAVIVNCLFHTLFVTIPSRVGNIENLLQSFPKRPNGSSGTINISLTKQYMINLKNMQS